MIGSLVLVKRIVSSSSSSSDEPESSSDDIFLLKLQKSEQKSKKHTKIRNYISSVVPFYDDLDFKSHFRLTRPVVETVLEDLQLTPINMTKAAVTPQHAFLLTLWILANQESFRGVADRFGLSRGHAHTVFIKTVKAMYDARKRYIKWPQNAAYLRDTVRQFGELRDNSLPNVVGCVDGTHILINGPRGDDSYYNRKGTHSMLVQGICNSTMVFTDVYCGWPGSTHDARMWKESPIYAKLKHHNLIGEEFHLLGDSAYPIDTFLMAPYKDNGHLTRRQKRFNQVLSSIRVVIEQAFGRLKGIWRRLKFLNIENLSYFKYIIIAACMLHNICIIENIDLENIEIDFGEEDLENIIPAEYNAANDAGKRKRDQLSAELDVL